MSIQDEQMDHLAKLAALHLPDEEKARLGKQVSTIIDFVGQLNEVDVEGTEPLSHPIEGMEVPLYTDAKPYPDPEGLLKNTEHPIKNGGIVMKSALNN